MSSKIIITINILLTMSIASCRTNSEKAIDQNPVQPNILWLVGENMKLDLGVYDAKNVHTPHLDSLAQNGLRFTHVFSTSPVCAPSRSAFMTGMYQTSTDTHNMRSHREDNYRLPSGVRPITHWLQDAGYFTANISHIDDKEVGTGKLDLNFANEGPIYQSKDWSALKDNQPFFAQINMPENEYDIYDRQTWKHDRVKWYGEEQHPQIATPQNVDPPPYYPDHPLVREEWARYLNSVSGMDIRIGWILDQLRKDGLAENTIIVFFGDNGRMEPRGIHWLWDTGIHVPLIIYYPKGMDVPPQYKPGRINEEVISLLDISATTLWMAGVDRPAGMQSQLFLGENPDTPRTYTFSARDRIDETVLRMRSVRGRKYHYIRNYSEGEGFATLNRYKEKCFAIKPLMRQLMADDQLTGPALELMRPMPYELLYDTEEDPHEINNLSASGNQEDIAVLMRMRATLDTWEVETNDLGRWLEPVGVVAPFEKEMHNWFGTPTWYSEQK